MDFVFMHPQYLYCYPCCSSDSYPLLQPPNIEMHQMRQMGQSLNKIASGIKDHGMKETF
jgi:hypothetical protein